MQHRRSRLRFGLLIVWLIAVFVLSACAYPITPEGGQPGEESLPPYVDEKSAPEDQLAAEDGTAENEAEHQASETAEEILLDHARSYAEDFGVPIDEAMRRLRLQGTLEESLARLESAMDDRFAGAWIEHEPEYRAVVRVTGSADEMPNAVQSFAERSAVPIDFIGGAEASLATLTEQLEQAAPDFQSRFSQVVGTEVDVKTGEIVLFIEEDGIVEEGMDDVSEETILLEAEERFGAPVRVESVDVPVGDGHTRGGAHLSSCTSGFVVRHPSSGTTGYITAGHCPNNQTYFEYGGVSYSTTFVDEIRDANQDVQWHTTPHIELPHFYAGGSGSYRTLQAQKSRSSQAVGGYVCHRGKTTSYSCGYIQSKTFKPTYTNACPGTTCSAVWIRVEGSSLKCFPGDSGGPWFLLYTAYGIYKGQASSGTSASDCSWAFYMASNYFGISLLFD